MKASSPPESPYSNVLVVGGGLAGLTASAVAARAGLSVTLVERATRLGGRAATASVRGYELDQGPHALYRRGAALRIWKELGLTVPGGVAPARGAAYVQGKLRRLAVDGLSLLSTDLLGWTDKVAAAALLRQLPRMAPEALNGQSVSEWLASATKSRPVRDLIGAFVRLATYAASPEVFSAGTALAQLRAAQGGVLYVDGGWQTLVRGLSGVAEGLGSRLVTGASARTLSRTTGGGYRLDLGDGTALHGDVVVLAVDPHEAARLVEGAGARVPAAFTSSEPVRMATLDVAVSRLPTSGPRFVLGIDSPLYLSVHSDVAELAPPLGAVLHAGKYLRTGEDPASARKELEALLDETHPTSRTNLVHAQHLPRMKVVQRLDLAAEGGRKGRPSSECPDLPGVLVAGDWVAGPGWMADAAAASGERAASLASSILSVRRAVA